MKAPRAFTSLLAPDIVRYLTVKHALGREYDGVSRVLAHIDHFLMTRGGELTPATFAGWSLTLEHLPSGTRRRRMQVVRNFCLYRRRDLPPAFVPDERLFPSEHQVIRPHLFTEAEVLRLLDVVAALPPAPTSPLRRENLHLAIVILYTTGLRLGELVRLILRDHDHHERTLLIRDSKFHKSRLVPLSSDAAREIDQHLVVRQTRQLAISPDSALLWHRTRRGTGYTGAGLSHAIRPLLRAAGIRTETGRVPRLHDFRHTFAVQALLRWYRAGADVNAKLPLLATYMGHVSIVSTEYYLQFVGPLATLASERFARQCGARHRAGCPRRCTMTPASPNTLGRALRGFFADHLPRVRGASPHTVRSYRDTFVLLLRFVARQKQRAVPELDVDHLGPQEILDFLHNLEVERHNIAATRNVRLAAIHAFFRYCAAEHPERVEHCQRVLAVPFKRARSRAVEYLEFTEIQAVLAAIDRSTTNGRRDYALLASMFNTGARVQEIVALRVADLRLEAPPHFRLFGKGRKGRICPLWPQTAEVLRALLAECGSQPRADQPLFVNHRGGPLTRFGVRYILAKYCTQAREAMPALASKRLHPHSMRHSTAVHLLRSGVDIVTISQWLGHASVTTTNRYATVDLEMKRKAIERARPVDDATAGLALWRSDASILTWLEAL